MSFSDCEKQRAMPLTLDWFWNRDDKNKPNLITSKFTREIGTEIGVDIDCKNAPIL